MHTGHGMAVIFRRHAVCLVHSGDTMTQPPEGQVSVQAMMSGFTLSLTQGETFMEPLIVD